MISIVGLGGTGSYLATPLVRYLLSKDILEKVVFIDGDAYEAKNIDRQDFMTSYTGVNKAIYACTKHQKLFENKSECFQYINKYINETDLPSIMVENGVMFICVDNYYFRKIADEYAKNIRNFTIISAGNEMTDGQVQIVQYRDGQNITSHSICSRHEEVASAVKESDRAAMSCEDIAKLPSGGQVIVANMMAATLMLSYFIDYASNRERTFYETFFDCKNNTMRTVPCH
jgi:hypothetical protein